MFKYINFLLLSILLLIFSCDEELKPVIEGCTIKTTCNYNADATDDNGCGNESGTCCSFKEGCNQWCEGDEGEPQEFDCADECNGAAVTDDCGVCDSDASNDCVQDCANDWGGSKEEDVCGVCGGPGIPFGECDCDGNVEDCNGDCGGLATIDSCDVCDADASNDNTPLTGPCDCNGFPNGEASIDGCGDCVGGDTGLTACANDCLGELGGDAVYDNCGEECISVDPEADCSEHCDNDPENNCVQDCNGEWGGEAVEDHCSTCDADGSNDCVQDCNGEWGGPDGVSDTGDEAAYDECGECDATYETQPAFPYGTCDCNGTPYGEANFDGCGDCVGGDTELTACANDCSGNPGGSDIIDNCEVCVLVGDTSCVLGCNSIWCNTLNCPQLVDDECGVCGGDGPEENHDCDGNCTAGVDCAGVCGGSLVIDDCSVCGGNNACIGCNDWYMENFICDDTEVTDKCCVEDDNNNDNRCKINGTGNGCNISACQKEYIMECDICNPGSDLTGWVPDPTCSSYCDYDGVSSGDPCSTSEGLFTEGEGLCIRACDIYQTSINGGSCSNVTCPIFGEYCDYDGAEVGTPCSTSEDLFTETEGEGLCVLNLSDDVYYPTAYITYYDTGCEDGTDSCCIEPTCNEPFTLSLEYIDASTLHVNYSSTEAIGGFQFVVDGAIVTGGSGGSAADAGFTITPLGSTVLGFSFSGATVPAGSGTLTNLNIDTGESTELCLKNVTISDTVGGTINTCPEYWQLTCIPIP